MNPDCRCEAYRALLVKLRLCAAECVMHQGGWDESPEDSVMNAHSVYVECNAVLEGKTNVTG